MEHKEMSLGRKICQVMKNVSYIKKEDKKKNGMYSYASIDGVRGAVQEQLADAGVFWQIEFTDRKIDPASGYAFVCIRIHLINADNMEERIFIDSWGEAFNKQDKKAGTAYSYAMKFAIINAFCIPTGDEDEDTERNAHEFIDKKQLKELKEFFKDKDDQLRKTLDFFNINKLEEIYSCNFERVLKSIHQSKEKNKSEKITPITSEEVSNVAVR